MALLTVACCLTACATTRTGEQKAAEAQTTAGQIVDSISNRTYTIDFDYVLPRRFPPHFLTSEYSVRINGDSIFCHLPFFGQSHRADLSNPYRSPLDFVGVISAYDASMPKRNRHNIRLSTKHDAEFLTYNINIYSNGKADLDIISTDRDAISFTGNFRLEEKP